MYAIVDAELSFEPAGDSGPFGLPCAGRSRTIGQGEEAKPRLAQLDECAMHIRVWRHRRHRLLERVEVIVADPNSPDDGQHLKDRAANSP